VYLGPVAVQYLQPSMTNVQVTDTLTDQPNQGSGPSKVGSITINPVVFNGSASTQEITSFQQIGVARLCCSLPHPASAHRVRR